MKSVIKDIAIGMVAGIIVIAIMLYGFFGAVLQESYKLYPRTYEEMTEHVHVHGR